MYFETVYLNWNPTPFKFQRLVHFFHHPLPAFQLKFDHGPALDPDPEVWILLTRHFDSQVTDNKRFMSLQVFLDDQENSSLAQQTYDSLDHGLPPLTATPLSNSTHLLARFPLKDRQATYLINFSFHDDWETQTQSEDSNVTSKPIALTLQIFSQVSMTLFDSTPVPLPFSKELEGQWTPKSSGGNHALATYASNPMWRITIEDERRGSVRNESGNVKFRASLTTIDANGGLDTRKPLNVKLIRSGGDGRVYDVERRDVVADSGSYTLGRAQLRVNQLLPGKYTIVPSTYQAGVIGLFKLQLECDLPLTRVESIPPEGAGMYKRVGCLSWEEERGGAGFWRLTGGKGLVKSKIKLQAAHHPGGYPIKLTLIQHQSSQDEGKIISPGIFTNALSGAAIGPLQLSFSNNYDYTILVEALGDTCVAKGEGYVLTVYADQPLSLARIPKETN
ncbi:cysteine protease [Puccinia graminis f. sp. tritici]|uniref:Cysteine protease n=2 Tax=Puccinia graminis f. sp. tritici TaxID=56615 RepID=A0A5B0R971_PUCGR|nr:cysteine protease [Puccinia graminis f. sp. tritici]